MIDHESPSQRHRSRPWALFGAAALVGVPFVVVMPALTIGLAVIAGVCGTLLVKVHRHRELGFRLVIVAAGLLVPSSLYVGLALRQH